MSVEARAARGCGRHRRPTAGLADERDGPVVRQAGAQLVGAGIAVEKAFQKGGDRIREQGVRVESLARVAEMDPEKGIRFC